MWLALHKVYIKKKISITSRQDMRLAGLQVPPTVRAAV